MGVHPVLQVIAKKNGHEYMGNCCNFRVNSIQIVIFHVVLYGMVTILASMIGTLLVLVVWGRPPDMWKRVTVRAMVVKFHLEPWIW